MKIIELKQGTPEWLAHRLSVRNASDAPAMMGVCPHKTRSQLIRELATGVTEERSDFVERHVFAAGHRIEDLVRPLAEEVVGEALYPVVGVSGNLGASFDGLTIDGATSWECKTLNAALREAMQNGQPLPINYRVQLQHQIIVSKAKRTLFSAASIDGRGEINEVHHVEYASDADLAERIVLGWEQLEREVSKWKPDAPAAEVLAAKVITALPALTVQAEGRVITSNLDTYRTAALSFIDTIKTDLQTDQDFADAASAIKFCSDAEAKLALVKEQTLAQTATIGEMFATLDAISGALAAKRIAMDKAVESRKKQIRIDIATECQADLVKHVGELNEQFPQAWLAVAACDWSGAMKGKRSVDTAREAARNLLTSTKVTASRNAGVLMDNWKHLGENRLHLFPDFATEGLRRPGDFTMVMQYREQQADEQKRKADDAAESAKQVIATASASSSATAEAAQQVISIAASGTTLADLSSSLPKINPADFEGEPMSTGKVSDFFGVGTLTTDQLRDLGAKTCPTPKGKAGTYWPASSLPTIGAAIVARIHQRLAALEHVEEAA